MVLIFLSWIYIIFTTINLGFTTNKIFNLKNINFVIHSILGLFTTTILASIWAIFGRINIEFHCFLLIVNCAILFKYKVEIKSIYTLFIAQLKILPRILKFYLATITSLIIAQCSTIPYVIDNESYYIQTIKWINEYGFVKGLVNLHLFLGQTSGWHITQSVYNFSFLYNHFNDLSGYCLLLGIVFSIEKVNEFYQNKNINYLVVGLLPIFSVFLFQFISAPSPDIPVYVFSFVIFFYFLENFKNSAIEVFNLIVILILFTIYIKNTTILFILIPIILVINNFKILTKNLKKSFAISFLILGIFILKNMIICGSILFPSKIINPFTNDYSIPKDIELFYYEQLKYYYGYFVEIYQYNTMTTLNKFFHWLSLPKLNGLFNKISILLVITVPIFIYKFQNKKSIWTLYSLMVLQLIMLFLTSPQYRFFVNFILFFLIFCFVCIFQKKLFIYIILIISLVPLFLILFFSINLNRLSNNKFVMELSSVSKNEIIFPHENTKNKTQFQTIELGNLKYNSPNKNNFFWASGDGDLPCVNKDQIEYFKKYFHVIPQMRTTDLKDGFYAKKLNPND